MNIYCFEVCFSQSPSSLPTVNRYPEKEWNMKVMSQKLAIKK